MPGRKILIFLRLAQDDVRNHATIPTLPRASLIGRNHPSQNTVAFYQRNDQRVVNFSLISVYECCFNCYINRINISDNIPSKFGK